MFCKAKDRPACLPQEDDPGLLSPQYRDREGHWRVEATGISPSRRVVSGGQSRRGGLSRPGPARPSTAKARMEGRETLPGRTVSWAEDSPPSRVARPSTAKDRRPQKSAVRRPSSANPNREASVPSAAPKARPKGPGGLRVHTGGSRPWGATAPEDAVETSLAHLERRRPVAAKLPPRPTTAEERLRARLRGGNPVVTAVIEEGSDEEDERVEEDEEGSDLEPGASSPKEVAQDPTRRARCERGAPTTRHRLHGVSLSPAPTSLDSSLDEDGSSESLASSPLSPESASCRHRPPEPAPPSRSIHTPAPWPF